MNIQTIDYELLLKEVKAKNPKSLLDIYRIVGNIFNINNKFNYFEYNVIEIVDIADIVDILAGLDVDINELVCQH
jgi:hypothetical protein